MNELEKLQRRVENLEKRGVKSFTMSVEEAQSLIQEVESLSESAQQSPATEEVVEIELIGETF